MKPKPRTTSTSHLLPFESLAPAEFERMCLWLAIREGFKQIEYLGEAGQDKGQDIVAHKGNERYVLQAKRTKRFGPIAATKEIQKLNRRIGRDGYENLLFVTSCAVTDKTRRTARKLWTRGKCEFLSGAELDERLKRHPAILIEFFHISSEASFSDPEHQAARFQLGADLSDFTGYAKEISLLERGLLESATASGAQVFGIFGMGGVGKTSLARHVGNRARELFPDGQIWLDLGGSSEAPMHRDVAMQTLIHALEPKAAIPQERNALKGLYYSIFSNRRILLVLDDASDAKQVHSLVLQPPCANIVTSRTHLAIDCLQAIRQTGFSDDEAENFLIDLARNQELSRPAASAIVKLCGNLPLAVRVAGMFLQIQEGWTANDYLNALEEESERLSHLQIQDRSVEAVLAVSARQLVARDPEQARNWQQITVFAGAFRIEAAAEVLSSSGARRSLGLLCERSLLDYDKATRLYRLHELLKIVAKRVFDYADEPEPLEVQEQRLWQAAARHAEYFLRTLYATDHLMLAKASGEEGLSSVKEHSDGGMISDPPFEAVARIGVGTLLAVGMFRIHWQEIRKGRAWAKHHSSSSEQAAELCRGFAQGGAHTLDLCMLPLQRIDWIESGLEAARTRGRHRIARLLNNLGNQYRLIGEPQKALGLYEEAVALAREHEEQDIEAIATGNIGLIYGDRGDQTKATTFYRERLALSRKMRSKTGEIEALGYLGHASAKQSKTDEAIKFHQQQLNLSREIGFRKGEIEAAGGLSDAYGMKGDSDRGIEFARLRLSTSRLLTDEHGEAAAHIQLGRFQCDAGDYPESIATLKKALDIAQAARFSAIEMRAHLLLCKAKLALYNSAFEPEVEKTEYCVITTITPIRDQTAHLELFEEARDHSRACYLIASSIEREEVSGLAYMEFQGLSRQAAEARLRQRDYASAQKYFSEMAELAGRRGDSKVLGEATLGICRAFASLGEFSRAARLLGRHLEDHAEGLGKGQRTEGLFQLGLLHLSMDEAKRASVFLKQALTFVEEGNDRHKALQIRKYLSTALENLGDSEGLARNYQSQAELARQLGLIKDLCAALGSLAFTLRDLGDLDNALLPAEEAVNIAAKQNWPELGSGLRRILAGIYQDLSDKQLAQGDVDGALRLRRKNLNNARSEGDPIYIGTALFDLGEVEIRLERWADAEKHFREQVTIAEGAEKVDWQAEGSLQLGDTLAMLGRLGEAREMYLQGTALATAAGHSFLASRGKYSLIGILPSVATQSLQQDNANGYIELFKERLDLCREVLDTEGIVSSLLVIGEMHSNLDQTEESLPFFREALSTLRGYDSPPRLELAMERLARQLFRSGQEQRAIDQYLEVLPLLRSSGNIELLNPSLLNLGACYYNIGSFEKAASIFREQNSMRREFADDVRHLRGLYQLGLCYERLGRTEHACELAEQSRALANEIGHLELLGLACVSLYNGHLALGESDVAHGFLKQGLTLLERIDHPLAPDLRQRFDGRSRPKKTEEDLR